MSFTLDERRHWDKHPSINVLPLEGTPQAPLSGNLVAGFMGKLDLEDNAFTPPRDQLDAHLSNVSTDSQRSHEKTILQRRFSEDFTMDGTPPTRADIFSIRSPLQQNNQNDISDVSNCVDDDEMRDVPTSPVPRLVKKKSFMEQRDFTVPTLQRHASVLRYSLHYHTHELIGQGSFGEVWSATHYQRSHEWYALKIGTKKFRGSRERDAYVREIKCVANLGDHPNIVKYHRAWQDNGRFYIAMQLCTLGTLDSLIQQDRLTLPKIDEVTTAILRGLRHIHKEKLLHLDLKPDNLFIDAESSIRIGDFGLCMPEAEWDEQEGDKRYLAPEILNGAAQSSADIFSMGLILYQMLLGEKDLPGDGQGWHHLRSGKVQINVIPEAQDFANAATAMLHHVPELRPSAAQMLGEDPV